MNYFLLSSTSSSTESSENSNSLDKTIETLKGLIKNPIFYIVISVLVLIVLIIYLLKRIIKPKPNHVTVVIRKGKVFKMVDEKSSIYFLMPFVDKVGAVLFLGEQELTSDKLFINNGPDFLYQINFTIRYKVADSIEFYKYSENIENSVIKKINEDLREFADAGNAPIIVKEYRANYPQILELINKSLQSFGLETTSFRINLIQPLGR